MTITGCIILVVILVVAMIDICQILANRADAEWKDIETKQKPKETEKEKPKETEKEKPKQEVTVKEIKSRLFTNRLIVHLVDGTSFPLEDKPYAVHILMDFTLWTEMGQKIEPLRDNYWFNRARKFQAASPDGGKTVYNGSQIKSIENLESVYHSTYTATEITKYTKYDSRIKNYENLNHFVEKDLVGKTAQEIAELADKSIGGHNGAQA